MMKPKISIIVPVYKVELYLSQCIESILKQTFRNFELLLIDDGSPDKSGEICNEYALKDKRIRVFHKENGGVSSARNLGLLKAKGEWICFVDSDDWIESNTLSSILPIEDCEINFVQFGFKQINSSGEILMKSNIPNHKTIIGKDAYFNTNMYHSAICGYLIKTDVIKKHSINFPETIKYGEDQVFILKALMCSNKILIINSYFYNYIYREGSAMNSSISFARAEDHLRVLLDLDSFINKINTQFNYLLVYIFKGFIFNYIRIGINSTYNLWKVKKGYSDFCREIKNHEVFDFCQIYDSYFLILFNYAKMGMIIPIIKRIKNKLQI